MQEFRMKKAALFILVVLLLASCAGNIYQWQASGREASAAADKISELEAQVETAEEEAELLQNELSCAPTSVEVERLNREIIHNAVIGREWQELYYDLFNATMPENATDWRLRAASIFGDPKVWTEPGSEFYHREGCERIGSVSVEIYLSSASQQGMRPCPDCDPIIWAAWD